MTARRPFGHRSLVTAEILLWRHGWGWLLAFSMALLGIGLQLVILQPALNLGTSLQEEASGLRARPPATKVSSQDPVDALHGVMRAAPGPAEVADKLLALAQAEGIALPRGDYQEIPHPALPVLQLRITQPVRTSYPQLRRYIEAVLREIPSASLDQVTAHRNQVGEGEVEVRLQWTVWRLAAPSPRPPAARQGT